MRIRQVRPEFWTDSTVAAFAPGIRLFYIGLWCVADDFGWFRWNETEIGAVLFPYESPKRRQRDVSAWGETLLDSGRLIRFKCGCAWIPTLERHQVNGGKKAGTYRDKHLNQGHPSERVRTVREVPIVPLVDNGSNGIGSGKIPEPTTDFKSGMAAAGLKVLP